MGSAPGSAAATRRAGLGDQPCGERRSDVAHRAGGLGGQRLGRGAPAPGEGDHDLVGRRPGAAADRQASHAGGHRDPARRAGHAMRATARRRCSRPGRARRRLGGIERRSATSRTVGLGGSHPPGDLQRELDRGAGEVQVRPVQDAQLDGRTRGVATSGPGRVRWAVQARGSGRVARRVARPKRTQLGAPSGSPRRSVR